MSLLSRISANIAPNAASHNSAQSRAHLLIEVASAHPTPEQPADALLAKLELSETDRAALKQANNGVDIRDQPITDLRKGGINQSALQYVGGGKYRG